ncbi:related to Mitochondrial clpX-like chaperone MCX1 [Saccharomycodes ludwigii]|uniref:Related to Mitochondrial clpX-like chaperone MCX1 n=1 Tax=Saccharomycodes ludwigii TaxID=36035 RepID=A0A376B277_9ASCO|nr:hypothetical protein SCDLUD_000995 [Saccharomycodes ludwigii]KAH3903366.1 hypothetical protein SCDLUD_000995 [Saccharomycodes ludwigii]SSD58788.1 related to Mitochondrial clpX-like chaperone MCX1 [Saccharomycodes ludwigii]
MIRFQSKYSCKNYLMSVCKNATWKQHCSSLIITRSNSVASSKLSSSCLSNKLNKIPTPKKLKSFLDEYIIGQDVGKKVLSVAVYNHYLRVNDKLKRTESEKRKEMLEEQLKIEKERLKVLQEDREDGGIKTETKYLDDTEARHGLRNLELQLSFEKNRFAGDCDLELSKSNVLMVGPSGSGKTLLATTLARILDVPISITDCTQLTQAGYIGEDVEVCIERLLINADYDIAKTERGIIVLDEIDKLAKTNGSPGTKDVSGEGVQQALLKILEGHPVSLTIKKPVNNEKDKNGNRVMGKKEETFVIDTSNILFILTGAFVGLDKAIAKRLRGNEKALSDNDNIDIEEIVLKNGSKTSALSLVTPTDLASFGLIPELIGRVPVLTALEPLKKQDLFNILKEPKNAILNQYSYIFKQFGVKLAVTDEALKSISQLALQNGTGARGLRGIMEKLLLDVNFNCPESGIKYVLINSKTVNSLKEHENNLSATNVKAQYYSRGQVDDFIHDAYEEDHKLGLELDSFFNITSAIEGKKRDEGLNSI